MAEESLELYEDALADYNKAIELNPNYSNAYNNRGATKNNLKQYVKAIEDFDKAIELTELNNQYKRYRAELENKKGI